MKIFSLFLVITFLCHQNQALSKQSSFLDTQDISSLSNATLVVGNVREAGGVEANMSNFVKQSSADFSHTSSFDGHVISVDMGPCRTRQPHIQGNWFDLPFKDNSQSRIMFEWFPSCDNLKPLLLPAIEKAFTVLEPGGELIIDHMPYSCVLPDDCADAFRKIISNKLHLDVNVRGQIPKEPSERYKGILSEKYQHFDPFTFHRGERERVDIYNILVGLKRQYTDNIINRIPLNILIRPNIEDHQTNENAVNLTVHKMANILGATDTNACDRIILEMQGKNSLPPIYDVFEWVYYMYSRNNLIIARLRKMGFTVDENAIEYHETNPYNGRKHAWIIKTQKP